jgi:hypothetical protein
MRSRLRLANDGPYDRPETPEGIAAACLRAVEDRTLSLAQLVAALRADGFDGFLVDYRRWSVTFYLTDGPRLTLSLSGRPGSVAPTLDTTTLQGLLADSDGPMHEYSPTRYRAKLMQAGCAGYLVSVSAKRTIYMGLDGSTHVEGLAV